MLEKGRSSVPLTVSLQPALCVLTYRLILLSFETDVNGCPPNYTRYTTEPEYIGIPPTEECERNN